MREDCFFPAIGNMYYKHPVNKQLALRRNKMGRGKVLDWARKAGTDIRDFLKRTKLASKLGRQFSEYIPTPGARAAADIMLDAAEQEGYGRRRGARRGYGLKLAGSGQKALTKNIEKQIRSHVAQQLRGQMPRYL
jgi:hypothetical protein